ncbi:MAG: response regulator [Myxococcota bacterium]
MGLPAEGPTPQALPWEQFVSGLRWIEGASNEAELAEAAGHWAVPSSQPLLGLFGSPQGVYRRLCRSVWPQLLGGARAQWVAQTDTHGEIRLELSQPDVPKALLALLGGVARWAPARLGYPLSKVQWSQSGSGGELRIEHARSRTLWARLGGAGSFVLRGPALLDDLSERTRSAELRLEAAEEERRQAQYALALRQQFLSTIAREVRTPLAGMIGLSELVSSGTADPEDAIHWAIQASVSGRQVLHLVDDVIALEGPEPAKAEAQPVGVRALGEFLVDRVRLGARLKGLEVELVLADDLPASVALERETVLRVLGILLDNAVRFTAQGRVRLEISVHERELRLCVRDTGPGLDPEALQRAFVPYLQASQQAAAVGSMGLGLAVARRLSRHVGAELTAESEVGVGSAFTMRLPLVVASIESSEPIVLTPSTDLLIPEDIAAKATINALVVEDNIVHQKILTRMLCNLGVNVRVAENGEKALEALSKQDFDLIFMDLQMPVMDGLAATAEIRRREGGARRARIMAVTANWEAEYRRKAQSAGMDGFLPKPVNQSAIEHAVRESAASQDLTPRSPH